MNIQQIVTGKAWKNFMAKLYGFGATVVILGALFKIMHWPFAGAMLTVGLLTEAVIFFFSAFEPPHADPDWSLVYPELAGMYEPEDEIFNDDEDEEYVPEGDTVVEQLDHMLSDANIDIKLIENLGQGMKSLSSNAAKLSDISDASVATNEYVNNMKVASDSVNDLTQAYKKTSDELFNDASASEEYIANLKKASESANTLSESYSEASNSIKGDMSATEAFSNSIKAATESANSMTQKYNDTADALTKSAQDLDFTGVDTKMYNEKVQEMSKNLTALNAVYELQMQSANESVDINNKLREGMNNFVENLMSSVDNTSKFKDESNALTENIANLNSSYSAQIDNSNKQTDSIAKLQETMEKFIENLNQSVDNTAKYQSESSQLTQNLASLNQVYGNMLSAMNVNK